jgi:protein-S-isoprenylcysteine O-methyltransferase Ste14
MTQTPDTSGVRFPPPFVYAIAVGLGFLLQRWHALPIASASQARALRVVSLGWLGLWLAISVSAALAFRSVHTSINPTRPTTQLARTGPYRYTRNPLYLGLALLTVAVACFANTLWPLLMLPAALWVIRVFVIAREERYLEAKFGDEYRTYKASVRRWL